MDHHIPLLRMACHSVSDRWSGYVIVEDFDDEEDEDPNRAPRNGIPDMDRRGMIRIVAKDVVDGALKRVKLERVCKMAEKRGLKRMGGMSFLWGSVLVVPSPKTQDGTSVGGQMIITYA